MNVYTYYMPVTGLWSHESQVDLIDLWAKSWRRHGWDPVVLTENTARKHPRYAEFKAGYQKLPSEYGPEYDLNCFLRYVAMSQIGGGLLTDYDVMNYGFAPRAPEETRFVFYDDKPPECMSTGVCNGPESLYEGLCQIFFTHPVSELDWNPAAHGGKGCHHVSDLTIVNQMFDGRRPKPEWLQLEKGCGVYPAPTWNISPLGHFCFAAQRDYATKLGIPPVSASRRKAIEELRNPLA